MSEENKDFFRWTRDKQSAFGKVVMKELENKVPKVGGTMTGPLTIDLPAKQEGTVYPIFFKSKYKEISSGYTWSIGISAISTIAYLCCGNSHVVGISKGLGIFPAGGNKISLGYDGRPWFKLFAEKINNGADIEIPNKAGTLALVSDIEDILIKHNLIQPKQGE